MDKLCEKHLQKMAQKLQVQAHRELLMIRYLMATTTRPVHPHGVIAFAGVITQRL